MLIIASLTRVFNSETTHKPQLHIGGELGFRTSAKLTTSVNYWCVEVLEKCIRAEAEPELHIAAELPKQVNLGDTQINDLSAIAGAVALLVWKGLHTSRTQKFLYPLTMPLGDVAFAPLEKVINVKTDVVAFFIFIFSQPVTFRWRGELSRTSAHKGSLTLSLLSTSVKGFF